MPARGVDEMDQSTQSLKRCSKCKAEKALSEFHKRRNGDPTRAQDVAGDCKVCHSAYCRTRYAASPDAAKMRARARRSKRLAEDPDGLCAEWRVYYKANSDKIKRRAADWVRQNPERAAATKQELYRKNLKRHMVANAKARARKLGIPFGITEADLAIPEVCPVLGIPIIEAAGCGKDRWSRWSDNSPTLDRLIPELGYVPSNITVISWRANSIKRDARPDELRKLADWVTMNTSEPRAEG